MRRIIGAVLAVLLTSGTLAAQVADTIVVTIQGDVKEVVLTAEYVTPPRIGDTIYFRADVTDSEGDPVVAVVSWAADDPTALRLEELPNGRARGIALRKATVLVWVMVEPITAMEVGILQEGALDWGRHLDFTALEQTAQLCAYLHRNGTLVAESPGPPVCPVVFLAQAPPEFWPLPLMDRRKSFQQLQYYAAQLRGH